jgi:hypothetical protein
MNFEKNASGLLVPDNKIEMNRLKEKLRVLLGGRYDGQIIRDGEVIDEFSDHNLVTNEGLNATLNIMLGAATQITSWYIGLFTGNYTPVATDTATSLPGNSTECTGITASSRPQWLCSAAIGQVISNALSKATFTFNATQSIYGGFLVSTATIGGTGGTSFSAAQFATPKNVVNLDQLLLTYTVNALGA